MKDMKLGLQLGYWGAGPPANAQELVAEAERLGFDSIWTAEAWGSDALTPLSWWGSQTKRVRLGTALCQLSGPHPDGHGHGRHHPRPPVGWTLRAGAGRVRSPGRRGLVRAVVREAAGPDAGVRGHRAPGHRPGGAGHQ